VLKGRFCRRVPGATSPCPLLRKERVLMGVDYVLLLSKEELEEVK